MILFIGNINKLTTEKELTSLLSTVGAVSRLAIMVDGMTRRSREYAYADIADSTEALAIINKFNSTDFMGSVIAVNAATPYQQQTLPWK